MSTTHQITTAQQLLDAGDIGRCELVRGELIMMTPAGGEHGIIVHEVGRLLGNHVAAHRLGHAYGAETGFLIERNPDTVRAADAAFVRRDPPFDPLREGWIDGVPDFVVEVVSPNDRAGEVQDKVMQWLHCGCRLVWTVNPKNRTVTAYQPNGDAHVYQSSDALTGGDVVPGLDLAVQDIFAALDR